jgi:uncharacterized RDD family membrane protein YckC
VAPLGVVPSRPCPACGREWGGGIACQFCDQVEGLPSGVHLSSPARRFGGYVLEGILCVFTLGIGWLVWSFAVYGRGQTPAKQLLGMRAVTLRTGAKATWGRMFVRELVAKPLVGMVSWVTLGIAYFWLVWDSRNQELWDKVVGTIVVNDPQKVLMPAGAPAAQAIGPARDPLDKLPFPARDSVNIQTPPVLESPVDRT